MDFVPVSRRSFLTVIFVAQIFYFVGRTHTYANLYTMENFMYAPNFLLSAI
jgi:hypothetical protein